MRVTFGMPWCNKHKSSPTPLPFHPISDTHTHTHMHACMHREVKFIKKLSQTTQRSNLPWEGNDKQAYKKIKFPWI